MTDEWRSTRFRLLVCAYDAPPCSVPGTSGPSQQNQAHSVAHPTVCFAGAALALAWRAGPATAPLAAPTVVIVVQFGQCVGKWWMTEAKCVGLLAHHVRPEEEFRVRSIMSSGRFDFVCTSARTMCHTPVRVHAPCVPSVRACMESYSCCTYDAPPCVCMPHVGPQY